VIKTLEKDIVELKKEIKGRDTTVLNKEKGKDGTVKKIHYSTPSRIVHLTYNICPILNFTVYIYVLANPDNIKTIFFSDSFQLIIWFTKNFDFINSKIQTFFK
jgi:hypothetical protein